MPVRGLPDQVVTRQRERQGELLNGKCVLDIVFGQCADYFVADSELGKCWVECSHAGVNEAFRCHSSLRPRAHEYDEKASLGPALR
jgi:hypothetical protein